MTPTAKKYFIDYLTTCGANHETLEKYSDFRLFAELLSKFKANFNYRNKKGIAPILYLLRDQDSKNADFLDDLVAYGANPAIAQDEEGSTPFLEAIYANDLAVT